MLKINFMLKIMLFTVFFFSSLQARYVCTKDQAFIDWLSQKPVDVNDDTVLVKYSDITSCKSQCRKTSTCSAINKNVFKNVAPMSTYYTETQKNNLVTALANKTVVSLKINTPSGTVSADLNNFNGTSFVFPTGTPARNSFLSKEVYNNGGIAITTYKLFPYIYTTTSLLSAASLSNSDITTLKNDVNNKINSTSSVVGFKINNDKLIFSTSLARNDFSWSDTNNTKTVFNGSDYNLKLVTSGTKHYIKYTFAGVVKYAFKEGSIDKISVITKARSTTAGYRVKITIGSDIYKQSSDFTSTSSGSVTQDNQIGLTAILSLAGYSCPLFSESTDIGGDVDSNVFSNATACLNKCYIQNSCVPWTEHPKCRPTAVDKSFPVSDYTGKTVFTKYNVAWDCNKTKMIPGKCLKYSQKTISGSSDFNLTGIGWKSKKFQDPNEALTSVAGLEQFQHLWSGWDGMCEHGTKYDDSWMSDPMTLLNFAMMAYKGAFPADGSPTAVSTKINEMTSGIQKSYDNVANSISTAYNGVVGPIENQLTTLENSVSSSFANVFESSTAAGKVGQTVTETASTATKATSVAEKASSIATKAQKYFNEAKSFYSKVLIKGTTYTTAVTAGSVIMNAAQIAMAAASPISNNDVQTANDFMKAQLGGSDASIAAVNYAQCMASIGLSFPNLVGFSVDSNSSSSAELNKPWKNVITMSDNQLSELMSATSAKFVKANYILLDHTGNIGHYFSLTALGYTQAGQVICGNGNVSRAINAINKAASKSSGGLNTGAMAEAAVGQAISYLPAPYNLIASIVFKIATSFSSGNACTSETVAMKWGIQQYKTNKGLVGNQCHFIQSDCSAKWAWGSCMRHKNEYCCYDQELTRIFVEGAKEELDKKWKVENCSDISLSDLKNISFRKCLSDEKPDRDKCFPDDKWNEMNSALKKQITKGYNAKSIVNSAMDAMPTRNDPWGHTIGD